MRASGAELLVHANEVAVVGLVEVVKHLPDIRRRFKHLVAEAAHRKPDAAILIDFPDFNLRLARELHRLGIPVFYFVSPQIWAWRTGRVKQIKKYVRKMIVIFPFEQEFYARHGVEVSYVGHPLAYEPPPQISREEFAAQAWARSAEAMDCAAARKPPEGSSAESAGDGSGGAAFAEAKSRVRISSAGSLDLERGLAERAARPSYQGWSRPSGSSGA